MLTHYLFQLFIFNKALKSQLLHGATRLIIAVSLMAASGAFAQSKTEQWKTFEVNLKGSDQKNPFVDVQLSALFTSGQSHFQVDGFYDGNSQYKIRFMPPSPGKWSYLTKSNNRNLNGLKGGFYCVPAKKSNHGPVSVRDTFNFSYADGKIYRPFGTTCYAWVHQGDSLENLTLKTLSNRYFNKIRMCIFPKNYTWNKNEPLRYPFQGHPADAWDYQRFNPAYFQHIEQRIAQLDSLGIEADLIVFHPYDRWGFSTMDSVTNDRYIRYIIARFAAFKNVWWSLANEYDLLKAKKMTDWEHYLMLFALNDPYHHLRSIHQLTKMFNHSNPLITHVSVQNQDTYKANELRQQYGKPVIYDECRYEGNIPNSWGDLTGQEMLNKIWQGTVSGGYVGHGECLLTNDFTDAAVLWWSKGGELHGESFKRIKFLQDILQTAPDGLRSKNNMLQFGSDYYLRYIPYAEQPVLTTIVLPLSRRYHIDIIDTWNMTIVSMPGSYSGKSSIRLPGSPGTAIRIIALN